MNNHKKDNHGKTCERFKLGKCQFTTEECGNIHGSGETEHVGNVRSEVECYTSKKELRTKDDMTTHKLTDHTSRVKQCRDGGNCSRQNCWYNHIKGTSAINSEENETRYN